MTSPQAMRVEACDDGNSLDEDSCTNACTVAICGDGFVRTDVEEGVAAFEACDDANLEDSDSCLSDCTLARCGDGIQRLDRAEGEPGYEACDDGNEDDTDVLEQLCVGGAAVMGSSGRARAVMTATITRRMTARACQPSTCGDGVVQEGEQCDDGNALDADAVPSTCAPARCGDGVVWDGQEACDDGNANAQDACTALCTLARCGDGIQRRDLQPEDPNFEECDDANAEVGDGCSDTCLIERCGNGRVDHGEACDDGNQANTDACTNGCAARCGDGVRQARVWRGVTTVTSRSVMAATALADGALRQRASGPWRGLR